jgi:flavin-dependent dehydrogenase
MDRANRYELKRRSKMTQQVIIIGGGVAGLCAANRLADLGIKSVILEAGQYPAHKVCGEFLSFECLDYLNEWGIQPTLIRQVSLRTPSASFEFPFPKTAGGLSHFELDFKLAERAMGKGVEVRTQTKVKSWAFQFHDSNFQIELTTGETLLAPQLIIATGRWPGQQSSPKMCYIGLKAHFEGIPLQDRLEMFSFLGAYAGIAPIEKQICNVACLFRIEQGQAFSSSQAYIDFLQKQHPVFHDYLSKGTMLFNDWMSTTIPKFGIKKTPNWPSVYFIGDAAMTIPPACGKGLTLAIMGGYLVAEYVQQKDALGFKRAWYQIYRKPFRWSQLLHEVLIRPHLGYCLTKGMFYAPWLADYLFNDMRVKRSGKSSLIKIKS